MDLEDIKEKLIDHEKRILELESLLKTRKGIVERGIEKSIPAEVLRLIITQLNKLKLSELAIITLKFHEKLTKEEIIKILKKLRKKGADSLRGGNFNRDLVRTGFVTELGKIGKETVYELTKDGKIEAEKLLMRMKEKEI